MIQKTIHIEGRDGEGEREASASNEQYDTLELLGLASSAPHAKRSAAEIEDDIHGEDLLEALLYFCRHLGRDATAGQLTSGLPLDGMGLTLRLLPRAASRADVTFRIRNNFDLKRIRKGMLPALLVLNDSQVCILTGVEKGEATVIYPQLPEKPQQLPLKQLRKLHAGMVGFAGLQPRNDNRASDYLEKRERHWFWSKLGELKGHFAEVALAAAIANVLAIGTALYIRQIYDRVVPNFAFPTLWVLTVGVLLAIFMEATIRITRAYLMDRAGKTLDQQLSSVLFAQAMGIRLEARPKSTGSFINQVREFDSVRDFFTSTTIGTITDIPFAFLFIFIIWMIGGPIAYVLLLALPLVVIAGLISQWPLAHYSEAHMKESSIRNGLLVEAMTSAETVKSIQGESRFQRLWEEYTWILAGNGMKIRKLTSVLTYFSSAVQQMTSVGIIVVGVYLIFDNQLSVGSMLACSLLSSRALGPISQMAGIFSRYQQMRTAMKGIDKIMEAPVDRPTDRRFVNRPRIAGEFIFEKAVFSYEQEGNPAINIDNLTIHSGIGTALLGANGSGKSTILKLMAGLYQVQSGRVLLDGVDMGQVEPSDMRARIGYLPQETRLFYGTLRENLLIGIKERDDDELLEALALCGGEGFIKGHSMGLDRMIGEGGTGVSGGQRQSIGLARLWLRDPQVVLLDEPTSAMDQGLEVRVIENLKHWAAGRTMIIATHRIPVLSLVERSIVMQHGRVVSNSTVSDVLAAAKPR